MSTVTFSGGVEVKDGVGRGRRAINSHRWGGGGSRAAAAGQSLSGGLPWHASEQLWDGVGGPEHNSTVDKQLTSPGREEGTGSGEGCRARCHERWAAADGGNSPPGLGAPPATQPQSQLTQELEGSQAGSLRVVQSPADMNALGGTLLAACLALLTAAAAGQTTINSTEGTLAYVSRLDRVVWLPPLPPPLPLPLPFAAGVAPLLLTVAGRLRTCRTELAPATLPS